MFQFILFPFNALHWAVGVEREEKCINIDGRETLTGGINSFNLFVTRGSMLWCLSNVNARNCLFLSLQHWLELRPRLPVAVSVSCACLQGYVVRIAGGNDKEGFPMKQGVLTTGRVRLLLSKGHSCYRVRRSGERRRKSVHGCIVDANLSVLHLVIVKKGTTPAPPPTQRSPARWRSIHPHVVHCRMVNLKLVKSKTRMLRTFELVWGPAVSHSSIVLLVVI